MVKLINEEVKYNGPRFNVVQKKFLRADGKEIIRDIVNPGEAVVILPITDENEIIFVSQLREAMDEIILELPAGIVDDGEEPIQTAVRELEEETGIIAKSIEYMITIYPSTGYTSEKVHIFLARDFENGKMHLDDSEEIINISRIPIEECMENIKNGTLKNASQIIAILLYNEKYMK